MSHQPQDQHVRDLLVTDFDRNFLIEASAGSGKTTVLVERLVQMLAKGHAKVNEIAALTFTRKAAGEMRSRFFVRLESTRANAEDARTKKRLTEALDSVHQAYIGTIHGFCARLLRDYANEAGLPAGFVEMSEDDAKDLQDEVWNNWLRLLTVNNDPIVRQLGDVGLALEDLHDAFLRFSEYSDVSNWPSAEVKLPDIQGLREKLTEYHQHMAELSPKLPTDAADRLMQKYRRLPRLAPTVRWHELQHVMNHLAEYEVIDYVKAKRRWPGGPKQCDQEQERWNHFCETVSVPLLDQWRAYRYPIVMEFLRQAEDYYRSERLRRAQLSFQDLLLSTVQLVRDNAVVRKQISGQWKRLLIDEFQDTDPLQAELLFLLTSKRATTRWLEAMPRPGSLLFVGDPKQSIYRFRRADMQVYRQVKERLEATGGEVLHLTANFRSQPALIGWINTTFEALFTQQGSKVQVPYTAMEPGRTTTNDLERCLRYITFPEGATGKNKEDVARAEAESIARFIHEAIGGHLAIERSEVELARGLPGHAVPDDFMILTTQRDRLQHYGDRLTEWGIPNQVTGGAQLNEFPGLRLLHLLLKSACDPQDNIALVGLLRSELCGLSDAQLFAFKEAKGHLQWNRLPTETMPHATIFAGFYRIMQQLAEDLQRLPIMGAVERTLQKLGVPLWSHVWGETGLGCLAKALICMRDVAVRSGSIQSVLHRLERLMNRDPRRDGLYLPSQAGVGVRIMNLHKAKGLEARVVILTDTMGGSQRKNNVELHVDRGEGVAQGYLHIKKKTGPFSDKSLAYPDNWQTFVERETEINDAEKQRLLYVAATRAKDLLVVCYRTSTEGEANKSNPWNDLIGHLGGASQLDPDSERQPASYPSHRPQQASFSESVGSIETAWKACLHPQAPISEVLDRNNGKPHSKWTQIMAG
ncbi:MAG TPA: UvrD-helicase domain-containing protein [Gemmatales bacterium]|nr:UvrD-helicase domain-containing protein [Gemmatales bacterium]